MNRESHKDLGIRTPTAAVFLPPATIEEAGWDILLALLSDPSHGVALERLAAVTSVNPMTLGYWLSWLEDSGLVTGALDAPSGNIRAALTGGGRELLDRYLIATGELDVRTHH